VLDSREPAARLYRTGDVVRYSPQGYLEFLGRLDQQIKILGHRIEPGEIEAALETHPGVRQAVVTATDGADGVPSLAAYVKPREAEIPTVRELRVFLQTKLPAHMIPSAFVFLAAFPLTPNGKIDRRQLPRPKAFEVSVYAAPHNVLEEKLAAIWAEALAVERVGVNDNFLDSGGHSLTAVQITFAIRREFSVDLPLQALFDFPTIGGLAVELETRLSQLEAGSASSIKPAPIRGGVPQPGNGAVTNARIG
jgi:acyl-CoA synthetase (AMP-forming)/AMP-acid ligase II